MGDRTGYSIDFDRTGIYDPDLDALVGAVDFRESWQVYDRSGVEHVMLQDYEYGVGSTDELALRVLDWMSEETGRLRRFTIVEDPCYEWLGTRLTYDPDVSMGDWHTVACDSDGNALISHAYLEGLWNKAESPAEMAAILNKHFGPDAKFSPVLSQSKLERALAR